MTARVARLSAAAVAVALLAGVITSPAQAKLRRPTKPVGVAVVAATASSLTLTASVQNAKQFRIYVATKAKDVNAASYPSAPFVSRTSNQRAVTITGLPYRTGPYYVRYVAKNRLATNFGGITAAYLRPPAPTGLQALTTPGGGVALTWSALAAERVTVVAATDPAMTQDRATYSLSGTANSFTPYGLLPARTYYFQVRAANGPSASAFSTTATVDSPSAGQGLRLASYNLLWAGSDGDPAGDGVIAPWRERRIAAAALVSSANPDVIAVQEGNSLVGQIRQVDSFAAALNNVGGDYVVAGTDGEGARTGPYLLYRARTWEAVGDGGRFALPDGRYAAFQVLAHRGSGARFLAVSVHLSSAAGGYWDGRRKLQTDSLAAQAQRQADSLGVPVVYAGDFNSHTGSNHAFHGPGIAFDSRHIPDSKDVSPSLPKVRYNSANQYYRTPRQAGQVDVDHIFAGPGVAVTGWQMLLNLSGGRFAGVIPSDHNPIVVDLWIPTQVLK